MSKQSTTAPQSDKTPSARPALWALALGSSIVVTVLAAIGLRVKPETAAPESPASVVAQATVPTAEAGTALPVQITKQDIANVKEAFQTILSERLFLEQHESIARERGFNQFAQVDAISQANFEKAMKFLGDFVEEKNLYNAGNEQVTIVIDTINCKVHSNIKFYQVVLKEIDREREAGKSFGPAI